MTTVDRTEVVTARLVAQQLIGGSPRPVSDAAILDLGVQETGRDGASWALANRGLEVPSAGALAARDDLVLVWSLRGAPHWYRRDEIADVMRATSPFSAADAAKRLVGAGKPLTDAGIGVTEGMRVLARELRRIVDRPRSKGEVSTEATGRLDEPYLRRCVPCQAIHPWENSMRFAALQGGLELEPDTSPPVLRRIPDWPARLIGPVDDPFAAPEHLQPIRAYLRLAGPATVADVAGYLDSTATEVKRHWPTDAVPVAIDPDPGEGGRARQAWWLAPRDARAGAVAPGELGTAGHAVDDTFVRLLGPYDLLLQARDRSVLVPDRSRHKALWPVIGRPGAVLVGVEVAGLWRPQAKGASLTVRLGLWSPVSSALRRRIGEQAERLAAHRGLGFAGLDESL